MDACAEAMAAMAVSSERCAHCGQHGADKRCSTCKRASYCGAECQNAAWKRHKKFCVPPLPLEAVMKKVDDARRAADWREVLKWEGRLPEVMATATDDICLLYLGIFEDAHRRISSSTGSNDHALSIARLLEHRFDVLGRMERFRDQGEQICFAGSRLSLEGNFEEAGVYFQRARNIGAAHGFFSVESLACLGLGELARMEGRDDEGRMEEGLDLLRNAYAAARLTELEDSMADELNALEVLIEALFKAGEIDEVEPLVDIYREAAKVESRSRGRLSDEEVGGHFYSVRLHEVLRI